MLIYNKDIKPIGDYSPDGTKYVTKISVITDIHIPHKERKNRKSLIDNAFQVLDEYTELVKLCKCDAIIHTGDFANQGWDSVSTEFVCEVGKRLHDWYTITKGNLYSVLGNHEVTYRRNNIFYAFASRDSEIIQKQVANFTVPKLIYPFIKTPSVIEGNGVKIYLMHFDPDAKYHIMDTDDDYHIGIYHTDLVTFESKQKLYHHKIGEGIRVTDSNIFENVDWAIGGHIHTPLETITLDNKRHTVLDIPGSMLANTIDELHGKVKLPFICIDENNKVYKEYVEFITGDSKGTLKQEVIQEEKHKQQVRKLIKEEVKVDMGSDFEEFLSNIANLKVRNAIATADVYNDPECIKTYAKHFNPQVEDDTETDDDIDLIE